MDEQRFQNACQLVNEGKFTEAYNEFTRLSETTDDPLDKAAALLYAANTLQTLRQPESATTKLSEARALVEDYPASRSPGNERFAELKIFVDFEDANLLWLRGEDLEAALLRFDTTLRKHRLARNDPRTHYFYDAIQIRRAFILADLGQWKEALPILQGIKSPQEYKEGVAFYLGHCYASADEYDKAESYLIEALKMGLPKSLEYRAHFELGVTYYQLKNYTKAKQELEVSAEKADAAYIKKSQIWRWLEVTCRALGLKDKAEHYARLAIPS